MPLQRLRLLNRYFFQDLGFAGNVNHYHDPRNSYLHEVLRSRRGIPITLAVLYIELAQQIGLHAQGRLFPGHFLVKLRLRQGRQQGEVLIDPFTGRSLSRDELAEMLQPHRRDRACPRRTSAAGAVPAGRERPRRPPPHAAQPGSTSTRTRRTGRRCWRCSAGSSCCCRATGTSAATAAWPTPSSAATPRRPDLAAYLEHCPAAEDAIAIDAAGRTAPRASGPARLSAAQRTWVAMSPGARGAMTPMRCTV